MEKLEFTHLAGYLPFKLKVQYEGIINGKELAKEKKAFEKDNQPWANWEYYEPEIKEIVGLKIGFIKKVHVFNHYTTYLIGIKTMGLKSFYNGIGFKPILHPLADLTKEIEVNGKKIIPLYALMKLDKAFVKDFIEVFGFEECKYSVIEKLFEWHFDVFGLIDKGLAVDINTLNL